MADLTSNFAGIKSPNPFWLASGPPTDKAYHLNRAFEAGWGGAVWKTLGEDPPIVNVSGPRYGALLTPDRRLAGFNNIELVSDRPLQQNLKEIKQIKRDWPDRALVVSLMVPCEENAWRDMLAQVADTGADGVELNFGCPHGMSERGMGSAVGQVPDYVAMVANWCKTHSHLPVIVKLTPNVTDIRQPARAAKSGGADAVSLINTINSIMGVDLEHLVMQPDIDGKGSHGGYCGPAVKPIALHMTAELGRDDTMRGFPLSAIGGISHWRDAAEFIALGAGNVQVCTAAMVSGFKIVEDMIDGLSRYLDQQKRPLSDLIGAALPSVDDWQHLNLNYTVKAHIDQKLCIQCGRCYIACEDTSHQAIRHQNTNGQRKYEVIDKACVGCNLCVSVCPIENCLTLRPLPPGQTDPRTGAVVSGDFMDWGKHPDNPQRGGAAEE